MSSVPRCALVTGGSRGIGAAIVKALAGDGWAIGVVFHRDAQAAAEVVEQVRAAAGHAIAIQADVGDRDQVEAAFDQAEAALGGRVVGLVNNAGVRIDGLAAALEDDDWERVMRVNLTAAHYATRRALRGMLRQRFGRIVNVSSVVGLRANAGQANYAAAKAGLLSYTRTVAIEVARRGVTVNAVAPGYIETDLIADIAKEDRSPIPAGRAGTPGDVASCVRFLCSAEAAYVTGATLVVDGGLSA